MTGLDASAITGSDQTGDIGWAHLTPRLVTQGFQIRREPTLKIRLPVLVHRQPRLKLAYHEARNQRHGIPKITLQSRSADDLALGPNLMPS